jgi:quercetin dioxygenase-like cupin family protein
MPRSLRRAVLSGIVLICSPLALAQSPAHEPALAISAADSQLQWGGCPAFMPKECRLAVLHGDPAQPNSDVLLKVPPGEALAHHWHTSAERMILVAGELEVAYDGQEPAKLTPGMYAYGPAKLPHSATCHSKDACVLFIAFEGPVDAVPTEGRRQ